MKTQELGPPEYSYQHLRRKSFTLSSFPTLPLENAFFTGRANDRSLHKVTLFIGKCSPSTCEDTTRSVEHLTYPRCNWQFNDVSRTHHNTQLSNHRLTLQKQIIISQIVIQSKTIKVLSLTYHTLPIQTKKLQKTSIVSKTMKLARLFLRKSHHSVPVQGDTSTGINGCLGTKSSVKKSSKNWLLSLDWFDILDHSWWPPIETAP